MKRRTLLLATVALAFVIAFTTAIKDHSGKFHTAGLPIPGETTCSAPACHGAGNGSFTSGGLADNAGPGSITLTSSNMTSWVYTPGATYHMTITITEAGAPLFGFSASVLDNGGHNAGAITVTDAAHTRTGTQPGTTNNIVYITHVGGPTVPSPSYQTITTDPALIIFDWTAPATNVGPVTFYYDGVASNNNSWEDAGDNVYAGSQIATPNSASSLLLAAPTVVPAFSSVTGIASLPQTITVGGGGLAGSVTVSAPAQFQVSLASSSGFASSLVLPISSGKLATTILYVRYLPTSASTSGNITLTDGVTTSPNIAVSGSTTATATVFVNSLISTSYRTVVGYPSVVKNFTVSGINLSANLVVTALANYEVSLSSVSGFGSTISIAPTSGNVVSTIIYIRYNPSAAGLHNGLVPIASTGATTKYITVGGLSVVPPVINHAGAIGAFSTTVGTPSSSQNFSISGSSLKWNVVVTAPSNFEVSLASGAGFGSSVSVAQTSGNIASTTIYVRYNPISSGTQSGNITLSSVGDPTSPTIALSGTSTNPISPTIATNNPPSTFNTIVGTPSVEQISNVSGLNLTANIIITAPNDFEVSLTSGSGFGSSVILTPSSGTVSSTPIYIRYNPASSGTTTSTISLTSTGASTQSISVSGNSTTTAINDALISNANLSIYPNPLNGLGYISFTLSNSDQVRVNLLNYQGQYIKEIYNNSLGSGAVKIPFDFTGLTKGVYLIEIQTGGNSIRKLVVAE